MAWSIACRLSIVVGGLTLIACSHGPQRADEAVPSLVLRDVFFTNVVTPAGRSYTTTYELGPRRRRFNPDQDENVVLVAVFDQRYTVNLRAALFRPDGRQHGMFEQRLESRPGGTWHTIRRFWSMTSLRPWPGEWHVKLWVDDRPMGQYFFLLPFEPGLAQHIALGREAPATATTNSYPEAIKAHIQRKWVYPCISNPGTATCEYKNATVEVEFGVRKDGSLGYVKLLKPSGDPTYDQNAIDTVKSAAPFPPVPDSFSLTGVPIRATMNYVVKEQQVEQLK